MVYNRYNTGAQNFYADLNETRLSNSALKSLKEKYAPPVPAALNYLGTYTAPTRPSRRRAVPRHLARFAEFVSAPLVKPVLYAIKRATLNAGLVFRDKEQYALAKIELKRALADKRIAHMNTALQEESRLAKLPQKMAEVSRRHAEAIVVGSDSFGIADVDTSGSAVALDIAKSKPKRASRAKKTSAE